LGGAVVQRSIIAGEPRVDQVQDRRFVDSQNTLREVAIKNADLDDGAAFGECVKEKVSAGGSTRSFREQAFDPTASGESWGWSVHDVSPSGF
jgi:hypothetical protein